jgi:alpha-glucosidase
MALGGLNMILIVAPTLLEALHLSHAQPLPKLPSYPYTYLLPLIPIGIGENNSEPPNDWISNFGGSAWDKVDDNSGQFYFHLFDTSQPDFNWKHPDVRADFLKTLRFWGDRGVSGFRVDVAMGVAKNISEPYAHYADLLKLSNRLMSTGSHEKHTHPFWDRDEVFEVYKEWREVFNEYNPPLT